MHLKRVALGLGLLATLATAGPLLALLWPGATAGPASLVVAMLGWALAVAGWTGYCRLRSRGLPWNDGPIRLSEEPEPRRGAPWRTLRVDFSAVPEERRPAVRDDLGRWVSVWRDPERLPVLRARALLVHERMVSPMRLLLTGFAVVAGGFLLLPTLWQAALPEAGALSLLLGPDPRTLRYYAILVLAIGIGPWIRVLLACQRIVEIHRGDLRGVDVTLDALRFELWVRSRGRPFTLVMAGILVLAYLVQLAWPAEAAGWVLDPSRIIGTPDPEPWRLLTAGFLHGGPFHLLLNGYALVLLGRFCEPLLGSLRTGLVYGLSLFGAAAGSLFVNDLPSVGSSGAIVGLLGAGLALERLNPRTLPRPLRTGLFAMTAALFLLGLLGHGLFDNAAHLGGLVAGFLATSWLVPRDHRRIRSRELVAFTLICVLAFGLASGPAKDLFARL